MPLFGNGDGIRSTHVTLSQIHIYYMLEQAQPTHDIQPNPYISNGTGSADTTHYSQSNPDILQELE